MLRLCSRTASTTGVLASSPVSFMASKTGVSAIRTRMNSPTATSTSESRKGTRQPHDRKSSSGSCDMSVNSPVASSRAAEDPICGQLPK
jgi:hypothetical protein